MHEETKFDTNIDIYTTIILDPRYCVYYYCDVDIGVVVLLSDVMG